MIWFKNKTKQFYKFLEDEKLSYLKKQIRKAGIKHVKSKGYEIVENEFNYYQSFPLLRDNSREIFMYDSNTKKLSREQKYSCVKVFILYFKSSKEVTKDKFLELVKYMQDNMNNLINCEYGLFIYEQNFYSIKKEFFNQVPTFIEIKRHSFKPKEKTENKKENN